jgi:hypothetical protein
MNKNLLVEIFVPITQPPNEGKIGTGYPVAKDRILTARHVLLPPNRDPAKPIEIRWHHQPVATRRWIEVPDQDVLWPGDEHCDAAVFACAFPPDARPWGVLSIESPRPSEWESEGFPDVGKRDDDSRVATAMRGHIHRAAKTAEFVALDLTVGADCDALHQGASGSPVMSDWKLLGVIVECPPRFDAKRLWAVPSCRLLEIPEFCGAIGHTPQTAALDLLEEQVVLALSGSKEAMDALEALMPIADGSLANRQPEDWAKRLVKAMLGLGLEHLVPLLRRAHRDLCSKRESAAANAVAGASNAILPAVFDRGVVRALQACMFDATIALIDLPVAKYTVAEIIMAGAEGRQACFRRASEVNKGPVATYRIKKEPPTSGIDPELRTWAEDIEKDLAGKFVDPEDDPFLDDAQRRAMIADRLGFEAEEQRTRYMAFRFKTDDNRDKARHVLMTLKERYPALVMLDLSTAGSRIAQENKLFQYFEEILKTALEETDP